MSEFMNGMAEKVWNELQSDAQQNIDTSGLTLQNIRETLIFIDEAMRSIDMLLEKTRSLSGFGSFYPMECRKKLMTMKAILDMELTRYDQ